MELGMLMIVIFIRDNKIIYNHMKNIKNFNQFINESHSTCWWCQEDIKTPIFTHYEDHPVHMGCWEEIAKMMKDNPISYKKIIKDEREFRTNPNRQGDWERLQKAIKDKEKSVDDVSGMDKEDAKRYIIHLRKAREEGFESKSEIFEEYAGQKKVGKDIEKRLKAEKSKEKSNKKKREQQKQNYYLKLSKKNKPS